MRVRPASRSLLGLLSSVAVMCGRAGDVFSLGQDTSKTGRSDQPKAKVQNKDRDMGTALRSIYQKTVEESVPDEMLDLLGKLD